MTANYDKIFTDSLVHHGYAPYRADMLVAEFRSRIAEGVHANSDHEAYRMLADAVAKTMADVTDPDLWDGDDAEVSILMDFLEWLPDLIRHAQSEKLREQAPEPVRNGLFTVADGRAYGRRIGFLEAAENADPFVKTLAGQYIRKSDGALVPGLGDEV